jgi:hypothetical protein
MNGRVTADSDVIAKLTMAADQGAAHERDVVTKDAIVRHMGIRHQVRISPDQGLATFAGCAMDGRTFANDCRRADSDKRSFSGKLSILWNVAQDRVRVNVAAVPELNRSVNDGEWINDNRSADPGRGIDGCQG